MSEDSISLGSLLELCQHQHRRIILGILIAEHRTLTVNDLTKTILKSNHHTPVTEAAEDELTEIHLSLYHSHLPKLASKGLINYDSERQLVEPTEQLEQVQPTLSTILDADNSLETPIAL